MTDFLPAAGPGPAAESARRGEATEPLPAGERAAILAGVAVPFLGLVAAIVFLWGWGFHWIDLGLLLGMYLLTALAITVGFHRLFVHRSFETYVVVKFVLAVLGSLLLALNVSWR